MTSVSPRSSERQPLLAGEAESGRPSWADEENAHRGPLSPAKVSVAETEADQCCCGIDPVLCWFRVFHWVGGLTATFGAVANIVHIQRVSGEISIRDVILRAYSSLFCIVVAMVQFQIPFALRGVEILQAWTYRGLFLIYIGLNTLNREWEYLHLEDISGFALVCLGSAYLMMGLTCVQGIETRRMSLNS